MDKDGGRVMPARDQCDHECHGRPQPKRDLEALLAAAGPGPWYRKVGGIYDANGVRVLHWLEVSNSGLQPIENADLAALAPDLAAAELERVKLDEINVTLAGQVLDALVERDEARKQRAIAARRGTMCDRKLVEVEEQLTEAQAEAGRLLSLLANWNEHLGGCSAGFSKLPCKCGVEEARAALEHHA